MNIWLDFGIDRIKGQGQGHKKVKTSLFFECVFVCYSHNSKSIKLNRSKFGAMIGYYPRTILLDKVRGQVDDFVSTSLWLLVCLFVIRITQKVLHRIT